MTWRLTTASTPGRDHLAREKNGQDAAAARAGCCPSGRPFAVAVVSDGCGSAPRSEVGACLLAHAAVTHAAARLSCGERAPAVARALPGMLRHVLNSVTHAAGGGGEQRAAFVTGHLLATLVGLVDDGETLVSFAFGDGLIVLGDEVIVLDAAGAPFYPAYALLPDAPPPAAPFFRERPSGSVGRAAVATDGLAAGLVNGLFGHRGRSLQRWLNVQSVRVPLGDDATVAVFERDRARS